MTLTVVPPPADPATLEALKAVVARAAPTQTICDAFTGALKALASGSSVRIESVPELLTTGQAADLLSISRTTMVKLLEEGKLPYEQPNVHRLVRLDDVLTYKAQRTAIRRSFLRDLTQETVADGSFFTTAAQADSAKEIMRATQL